MTYRLAPAPRFADARSWDCALCEHRDLVRPVFLTGPDGLIAVGSGCALNALAPHRGRVPSDADRRTLYLDADRLTREARAIEDIRTERRARYAQALLEFDAVPNGGPDEAPALASCRTTYHQAGGFPTLGILFPCFLLAVALTGVLPEA